MGDAATDWAHLYVRACVDVAFSQSLSALILCVDVVTEFASAQHFLAFTEIPDSKQASCSKLTRLGFSSDEIRAIPHGVHYAVPWLEDGAYDYSRHLVILQACVNTWSSPELIRDIVKTSTGPLAGRTWADLCFCFIMVRTLKRLRINLQEAGLIHHVDGKQCAE